MQELLTFQVDAFASELFEGNPAAVCFLEKWLSDESMQSIAIENNLSETAFIVPDEENDNYAIRWFTPNGEVELCGHATLASAFVLFECLEHPEDEINFTSPSGELSVQRDDDFYEMDFPALSYESVELEADVLTALSVTPKEVYKSKFDLLVVLDNEEDVANAEPDLDAIAELPYRGVILTSHSAEEDVDIYSRCFYPAHDVPEDPVTGSAHCVIAPYWSEKLGKEELVALQGDDRQGHVYCDVQGDRVLIAGQCQLYMTGTIYIGD